jgi:hypothetical protein
MKLTRTFFTLGLATLSLTACGDIRDDLGLGRSAPDEFAVVDRAPLSVPPDFTLRPPQPGAPRPQEVDPSQRASDVVFGEDSGSFTDKRQSSAERELMTMSGAVKADPNIREVVDKEAAQRVVGNEHLVDQLLWWRKQSPSGTTVNAAAEAARIKAAKEKGLPLNKGATPVIERQKSGWLGL